MVGYVPERIKEEMMENPSMYPTAADYANSAAQEAKSEVEKLKKEIADLKDRLSKVEYQIMRWEPRRLG